MSEAVAVFLWQTFATGIAVTVFALPTVVFLTYCWQRTIGSGNGLEQSIETLDWPRPANAWRWRLKHQWRVLIHGPPKRGSVQDIAWFGMKSFQRLGALTIPLTYVMVALLCIVLSPLLLIPLIAAGSWVLVRTPNWPISEGAGP